MPPNCSDRPVPFYCFYRLFYCYCYCCSSAVPFRYSEYFTAAVSTDCYWLTALTVLLLRVLLLKVLLPDVLLLTDGYRVLLPSVLPLTVLFYFTALSICFYYYFYYRYCYCCCCCYRCYCYYCCYYYYCYRYYFWFTTVLVATSRKVWS